MWDMAHVDQGEYIGGANAETPVLRQCWCRTVKCSVKLGSHKNEQEASGNDAKEGSVCAHISHGNLSAEGRSYTQVTHTQSHIGAA